MCSGVRIKSGGPALPTKLSHLRVRVCVHMFLAADDSDDGDYFEVRPKQRRVQNVLYLNDEEDEEDGEEMEQEHEGRKVMVSSKHTHMYFKRRSTHIHS